MAIKNFYTGVYIGDNLGIGVDAPASKLHVNGNVLLSNNNELRWLSSTGTQESILELNASDLLSLTGPGRIRIVPDGNAAIDLFSGHNTKYIMSSVHSWEDNNSNVALRITAGGNVGIGTTNPGAKLEVAADATTNVDIAHFSNSNDIAKAKISLSANSSGELSLIDGSNNTDVFISSNGDSHFKGGDVGIGVDVGDIAAKLDVAGGIKVANDTDTPTGLKQGTLRYRLAPSFPKSQSMVDMCMQTGPSSYAWVNIVTNTWSN